MDIEKLRLIGWKHWDPIGLLALHDEDGDTWPRDEYDTYLLQAAGMLVNGKSIEEVADYLYNVETEHMGLGKRADARARASIVAKAIANL
jgi:hypothetical protein